MGETKQFTLSIMVHTCKGLGFLELGRKFMGWCFMRDLRDEFAVSSHVKMYFKIRDKIKGVMLWGTEVRDFKKEEKLRIVVCSDATRHYFCMGVCTVFSVPLTTDDCHICYLKYSVNKVKNIQSVWFFCNVNRKTNNTTLICTTRG